MDGLTQRERIELMAKIQRLEWLLKECIGIEEYELCSQIRNVIQRKYELLSQMSSDSSAHYESTNQTENEIE
jgi:protein-arginine kinase activator protein McsA